MKSLLLLLLLAAGVTAQPGTPDLDTIRDAYTGQLDKLELPLTEWHDKYVAQLKALQSKVQQAGDLEQFIIIGQEIDGTAPVIDAKYTEFTRLRRIYDQRNESIEKAIAEKSRQLMSDYQRKLVALQTTLTKAAAIDKAIKVRDELAELNL